MSARAVLESLHPKLNPPRPAADPSVTRVEHPYSPLDSLVRDLERPFGNRRALVYGPPGSGKPTELPQQRCAVAFPNESLWHYPHPLLTLRAVSTRG